MGATDGGLKFSIDQKFSVLNCDQLVDDVGSRLTSRAVMFDTNLAEPTLGNLKTAINGGTSASGAGTLYFSNSRATSARSAGESNARSGTSSTVMGSRSRLKRIGPT